MTQNSEIRLSATLSLCAPLWQNQRVLDVHEIGEARGLNYGGEEENLKYHNIR